MLTSQRIIDGINRQIGHEFAAMLQYIAIAAHFDSEALPELSAHFTKQANEEKLHADKFIRYVSDTGARLSLPAIPQPQCRFATAEEAVKLSLDQERSVTDDINALVHAAKEESDYTTENFLQWFIREQLEEVASMQDLLNTVRRAGESNLLLVEDSLARENGRLSRQTAPA